MSRPPLLFHKIKRQNTFRQGFLNEDNSENLLVPKSFEMLEFLICLKICWYLLHLGHLLRNKNRQMRFVSSKFTWIKVVSTTTFTRTFNGQDYINAVKFILTEKKTKRKKNPFPKPSNKNIFLNFLTPAKWKIEHTLLTRS